MKTIREHLNSLPEPYRTSLLQICSYSHLTMEVETLKECVIVIYGHTKYGLIVWDKIKMYDPNTCPTAPPQSEPPVPNNRSDSDNEHKTNTVKKPTLINPLFQMWSDPTVSQDINNFGPPYFTYDHDKF